VVEIDVCISVLFLRLIAGRDVAVHDADDGDCIVPGPLHIRTPLGRVLGRGAAKSGTEHFWRQRLTAVANVPLTIAAIAILITLLGRNQAAVAQILGSPAVSIIMVLFVMSITIHMQIGMAVIIEDYVHDDSLKLTLLMANTFFAIAVGLAAVYGILKLSFRL
jgi:succinate dehydrogenase / fumarate reductase, membrane anchor subunit